MVDHFQVLLEIIGRDRQGPSADLSSAAQEQGLDSGNQ